MTVALSPANNPMVPSWAERERLLIKAIFVRDFRGLKTSHRNPPAGHPQFLHS